MPLTSARDGLAARPAEPATAVAGRVGWPVLRPPPTLKPRPTAAWGQAVLPAGYSLRRIFLMLAIILMAGGGAVLFFFNPSQFGFYPFCLFHRTTGLLCPGCGSLRALHQLLHGHIATAFRFNPLLVSALPFGVWFGARYTMRRVRRQPARLNVRPIWLWLGLAMALVFSVWRNIPGTPFALLPR